MEEFINWLMVYAPSAVSIITCVFTFLKCVKSIKDNVGDTNISNKKLNESLDKISTAFAARQDQFEIKVEVLEQALEDKAKEVEALAKENEELRKAVSEVETLSDNLNTIKNQLTVIVDKEQ